MSYARFEDPPVWKDAARLSVAIACLTDDAAVRRKGDLADQLERASLSVSNNMGEGFELGTTEQLLKFLHIAKGSAAECRSMLTVVMGVAHLEHARSRMQEAGSKAESIGRQLGAWCQHLQNSGMKGSRHVNDAVREPDAKRKRVDSLLAMMKERVEEERRKREEPSEPARAPTD